MSNVVLLPCYSLFIEYSEESFSTQYENSTPILCNQYIDDIVGAALCSVEELCFINFVINFIMIMVIFRCYFSRAHSPFI